jgi:uncharacterized OsmC-like protein
MKDLEIDDLHAHLKAVFTFSGSFNEGSIRGDPDHFEVELSVEAEEAREDLKELVRLSHRSCYAENTLRQPVPIETVHRINGETVQINPDDE